MPKRVAMQIRVPAKLKSWVEGQVDAGRYRDSGRFFEYAARQSLTVATREQAEAKLLEALDGPPAKPLRKGELRAMEDRIRRRYLTDRPKRKSA